MTTTLLDGVYEEKVDDVPDLVQALLAGAAPIKPPKSWFDNPSLNRVTPLTITADGQVFGHIAPFDVDHIGLPPGTKPPRSRHNYAFFKTGVVASAEGEDVAVGQITLAGGHAALSADAGAAVKHYDDTASAFADVNVGEDNYGIWVSGALRPNASEEQIRAIRASAPSGDWRPINGGHELVAICQVNVPGFPVARTLVAGGEMMGLVAAGASEMYQLRLEELAAESVSVISSRLTLLEDKLVSKGIIAAGDRYAIKNTIPSESDATDDIHGDGTPTVKDLDNSDALEGDDWQGDKAVRKAAMKKKMLAARKKRLDSRMPARAK